MSYEICHRSVSIQQCPRSVRYDGFYMSVSSSNSTECILVHYHCRVQRALLFGEYVAFGHFSKTKSIHSSSFRDFRSKSFLSHPRTKTFEPDKLFVYRSKSQSICQTNICKTALGKCTQYRAKKNNIYRANQEMPPQPASPAVECLLGLPRFLK